LDFNQRDLQSLFNAIDINRNGEIDYDEFLRIVRGPMNENRKKLVKQAFVKLDRSGNGIVDLDDIRG
jgi:Ca2+-binding EF-hand superfamily protein